LINLDDDDKVTAATTLVEAEVEIPPVVN